MRNVHRSTYIPGGGIQKLYTTSQAEESRSYTVRNVHTSQAEKSRNYTMRNVHKSHAEEFESYILREKCTQISGI